MPDTKIVDLTAWKAALMCGDGAVNGAAGTCLRDARMRKRLGEKRFAELTGLSPHAVRAIETGAEPATSRHILAYCKALQTRPVQLFRNMAGPPQNSAGHRTETVELLRAFRSIQSPPLRARIIELVYAVASEEP